MKDKIVRNNPDEYIKRGDNIPSANLTYKEKLHLSMRDKISEIQIKHFGEPMTAKARERLENIADEVLVMLQEAEKFRASEPYFYIVNAKRFLDDVQCHKVALALLGTKDLERLFASEEKK